MSLINLTPHPIRVYTSETPDQIADTNDGLLFRIDPIGKPARIAMIDLGHDRDVTDDYASGYTTYVEWIQFGACHGLPQPEAGTTCIVSLVVALSAASRSDLVFPLSEVRNQEGTVIGCRGFGRVC